MKIPENAFNIVVILLVIITLLFFPISTHKAASHVQKIDDQGITHTTSELEKEPFVSFELTGLDYLTKNYPKGMEITASYDGKMLKMSFFRKGLYVFFSVLLITLFIQFKLKNKCTKSILITLLVFLGAALAGVFDLVYHSFWNYVINQFGNLGSKTIHTEVLQLRSWRTLFYLLGILLIINWSWYLVERNQKRRQII